MVGVYWIVGVKSPGEPERTELFHGEQAALNSMNYLVSELSWAAEDYPPSDPDGKLLFEQACKLQMLGQQNHQEFEVAGTIYWRKKLA